MMEKLPTHELVSAVRLVAEGGTAIDPSLVQALMQRASAGPDPLAVLTRTERDVLRRHCTRAPRIVVIRSIEIEARRPQHLDALIARGIAVRPGPEALLCAQDKAVMEAVVQQVTRDRAQMAVRLRDQGQRQ